MTWGNNVACSTLDTNQIKLSWQEVSTRHALEHAHDTSTAVQRRLRSRRQQTSDPMNEDPHISRLFGLVDELIYAQHGILQLSSDFELSRPTRQVLNRPDIPLHAATHSVRRRELEFSMSCQRTARCCRSRADSRASCSPGSTRPSIHLTGCTPLAACEARQIRPEKTSAINKLTIHEPWRANHRPVCYSVSLPPFF